MYKEGAVSARFERGYWGVRHAVCASNAGTSALLHVRRPCVVGWLLGAPILLGAVGNWSEQWQRLSNKFGWELLRNQKNWASGNKKIEDLALDSNMACINDLRAGELPLNAITDVGSRTANL